MTSSKIKSYLITGVVALVAVAIANRVETTRKLVNNV